MNLPLRHLFQKIRPSLQTGLFILIVSSVTFGQINHGLKVKLFPDNHRLEIIDKITLSLESTDTGPLHFILHKGLKPEVQDKNIILKKKSGVEVSRFVNANPLLHQYNTILDLFEVKLPPETREFTIKYQGELFHPVEEYGEEYARSFSVSPGIISQQGIYLSGSSFWYPHFSDELVTFNMEVELPAGWSSVSQGLRKRRDTNTDYQRDTWVMDKPQEEIYLISAEFTEYGQAAGAVEAMAFLRKPDPQLAQKYLDTTAQYLELYRKLLGPYPYGKFALVENFWETGYGMPSFTLLGPRVIRFPFILHSSYPHEILHNWWGNGVYTDYEKGNWAEGLTTYLADHLIKEQRGIAVEYRRSVLQKYTNYVTANKNKDFPLTEFRSRHSAATEAVGYGKTMMLFHILRQQLGDQTFVKALHHFYRKYKFKVASFDDVETTFNNVTDDPLELMFEQWVKKTGAPSLRVRKATAKSQGDGYILSAIIEQIQETEPYWLKLPIAVHMEGVANAFQTIIDVNVKKYNLELMLPVRPVHLDVDPEFDVFRTLDHAETPPAMSQVFGAEQVLVVLPANAPESIRQGYHNLAKGWQKGRSTQMEIKLDNELDELPTDRAVWLFGWKNRFRPMVSKALSDYNFTGNEKTIKIDDTELKHDQHSIVIMARNQSNSAHALAWLAADNVAAMPGLGRKLPHYNKYSYLAFTGDEPTNVFKGQWPVVNSPMSITVSQSDNKIVEPTIAKLKPRVALAQLPPVFSEARMLKDIEYLASDELEGRGLGTPGIDKAADYIAKQFSDAGLQPCGDKPNDYFQIWTEKVDTPEREVTVKNVIGIIPGTNLQFEGQSVVVGAHYDSHGRGWPNCLAGNKGKIHPGADDNASGISVMLEMARLLGKKWQPERAVVFAAFSAEEAGKLGSLHYTSQVKKYPVSKAMAMINIDTVGQLGQDALTIFGSHSAREWVHIFRGVGYVTGVPIKQSTIDTGNGDEKSFLDAGVPSVHFFSGARDNYHRPTDTVDRIDTAGLVKTAAVLKETVEYLAARPEPLTSTLTGTNSSTTPQRVQHPHKKRHVVLGTVPDFGYTGTGVRLDGVTSDTPAAKVGLQEGDIIVRIEDTEIETLFAFSELLKTLDPGSEITIVFMRNNVEHSVTASVIAR